MCKIPTNFFFVRTGSEQVGRLASCRTQTTQKRRLLGEIVLIHIAATLDIRTGSREW